MWRSSAVRLVASPPTQRPNSGGSLTTRTAPTASFSLQTPHPARQNTTDLARKFQHERVAIVGVGGTGSYILDMVAKTWVREIHLFDSDRFLQYNAFRSLDRGKLYVCCRYRAVTHLCACGCGVEINTPLHPTGWTLRYDGVSVSLSPSVGNWSEKCQSHYWITNNRIRWCPTWPWDKILQTRRARDTELEHYFDTNTDPRTGGSVPKSRLARLWGWILRRP